MSEDRKFGRLDTVPIRDAWESEPRSFTPWLADNLDRLSDILDIPLQKIGTEVGLPTDDDRFSADIHAINENDDSSVLIENQFTPSDHTHLGQILAYLAGLEARTVIWVAPSFREAHLAAIKWLNDHTTEEFAFFAVTVRVIRIEDSPMVPLFEIAEKPNAWERQIAAKARAEKRVTALGSDRQNFWSRFESDYLPASEDFGGGAGANKRRRFGDKLAVSYYLAKDAVGIYMTSLKNVDINEVIEILREEAPDIEDKIGLSMAADQSRHFFSKAFDCDFTDENQYPEIRDWLITEIENYTSALESYGFRRNIKNIG